MLRTRHREEQLLQACLGAGQPFVVDNTNVTRTERQRYVDAAKDAGFRVIAYYFESRVSDALLRKGTRPPEARISERGIKGTSGRLEIPARDEGFDELFYVRIAPDGLVVEG